MSKVLFKDHSIGEIEACLSKALTELLGHAASFSLNDLVLSSDTLGTTQIAKFSAHVEHEYQPDYGEARPL